MLAQAWRKGLEGEPACVNIYQHFLYFLPAPQPGRQVSANNGEINIWKRLSQEIRQSHKKFMNFQQVSASVITDWLQKYNLREVQ